MSERPRNAASPTVPVEDPPRDPDVEEVTVASTKSSGSRPSSDGRKRRATKKPSSSKSKNDRKAGKAPLKGSAEQLGDSGSLEDTTGPAVVSSSEGVIESLDKDTQTPDVLDTSVPVPAEEKNRMDEYLEMTRNEKIARLSEKLAGFKKPEKPGSNGELRKDLYEHRAAQIVERSGLSAERAAMLAVQAQYLEAKTLAHRQGFAPDNIGDLKKAYTDSLFEWNTSLLIAAEKLDGKDRLEALAIRKRDTILRPQTIEIEARRAGIDAKVWYSLDKWINEETPGNLGRIVNAPASGVGKGWAWLWHKSARGNSTEAKLSRGELGRKYARATRILGGAAGATAIALAASPVTAAAVGLTFAVYTARGVIGTLAGMAGGYAGGGAYQRLFGTKKQETLNFSENVRKQFASAEEFESFQALYERSGTKARSNEKAMWQMAGAMIVGGGVGIATSPLAHGALEQMGALKSVQDASDTIAPPREADSAALVSKTDSPEAPLQASSATAANAAENTVAPAEHVTPTEPENLLKGAVIGKGEGFNTLFEELRDKVRTDLSGMEDSSPVMKYLFSTSPTELSDRIGAFNPETGASMVMHQGDQLFLDENGNLWFEKLGETPRLVMENDPSSSQGYVIHEFPKDIEMRATNPVAPTLAREASTVGVEPVLQEAITTSPTESVASTEVPYEAASSAPPEQAEEPSIRESVVVPVSGPDAQNAGDLIPRANLGDVNQGADTQTPVGILKTQSLESWAGASIETEAQILSNAHGVEINPSEPAGYEWKVPGTNLTFTVAFGENAAATVRWALRELELHPESRVLINYTDTNPSTGAIETNVGVWQIGEDGKPEFMREIANPENGLRLRAADPQDFIRKLP